ncbi:MAG: hypothetical protein M1814_004644 [Vezdaea aestivalis]|nr:MAG: hypothetical protein M1814_004644 [Vezdaea aestivalis]
MSYQHNMLSSKEPTESFQQQGARLFSCLLCKQRKVKCDRIEPCTNCSRARAKCLYRAPAPPRRRKRPQVPQADLHARLRQYEEVLRSLGVKLDDAGGANGPGLAQTSMDVDSPDAKGEQGVPLLNAYLDDGKIISSNGRFKYLDNQLWSRISHQLHDPSALLEESDEEGEELGDSPDVAPDAVGLLFDRKGTVMNLSDLHPDRKSILQLWGIFLENVDPLTKILHPPTVTPMIESAIDNLESASKGLTALLFAIYSLSVLSCTPEQCEARFGETKEVLLARYRAATQSALVNAKFLRSSDLLVYQAFNLHLMSLRPVQDATTLWHLTGVALRIGQSMGLHRDGASLGLPPFEAEMRRRIWWHIHIFDHQMANLCAVGPSLNLSKWEINRPRNLNDADLSPDMLELPPDRIGATDLLFCAIRYEIGSFLQRGYVLDDHTPGSAPGTKTSHNMADKDRALEELASTIEDKFLRYYDPLKPFHLMASAMVRASACRIKFILHHPRHYSEFGEEMPKTEQDLLFDCSVKMLQYDNLVHDTEATQRFLWHVNSIFGWHAFLFLLTDLCTRIEGAEVENAWKQIETAYKFHPSIISNIKEPLYKAAGSLTLKAWTAREAAAIRRYGEGAQVRRPAFIVSLLEQRRQPVKNVSGPIVSNLIAEVQSQATSVDTGADGFLETNSAIEFLSPDPIPINWEGWESLLQDFDGQDL